MRHKSLSRYGAVDIKMDVQGVVEGVVTDVVLVPNGYEGVVIMDRCRGKQGDYWREVDVAVDGLWQ